MVIISFTVNICNDLKQLLAFCQGLQVDRIKKSLIVYIMCGVCVQYFFKIYILASIRISITVYIMLYIVVQCTPLIILESKESFVA